MFDKANRKYFQTRLPRVELRLGSAMRSFGNFLFLKSSLASPRRYPDDCRIIISGYYDRPYKEVMDTLVHEMIHLYIWYYNLQDSSPHGHIFRKIMSNINTDSDRHIRISNSSSNKKIADTKPKISIMCLVCTPMGKFYAIRTAKTRFRSIYNALRKLPRFSGIEAFVICDHAFDKYPRCIEANNLYDITPEEIELLRNVGTPINL